MAARLTAIALATALTLSACTGTDDPGPDDGATPTGRTGEPGAPETGHVDNPFAGADLYVNPVWSAKVEEQADATEKDDADLADDMRAVATQPTAVWMDRIGAIEGNADGPGLRYHLDEALAQREGDNPLVVTLVIYDLPGRDCFALASNGELPATDAGLATYKTDYIDPIAKLLADEQYEGLRFAAVIEPDSLPNLVTNSGEPQCQAADPYYRQGVVYALDAFAPLENVYTYIDAAHSGWLGWDNNAGPTAQLFAEVARSTEAGFASIDGFVTNTANTTPLEEPFLTNPDAQVGGQQVKQSSFYEYNPSFDEADWTADLYRRLVAAGFDESIGMIIDTSRNGWGGPERPTNTSASTDLETYVADSKVDRRVHRGAWCNPAGAGLGRLPQALPAGYPDSHLDAFLWVKPPGESDGSSQEIANDEGKGFDRMCDPTFATDRLAGNTTHALPDAPISGKWFAAQFAELVAHAYPTVGTPIPASRDEPGADKPVGSGQGNGDNETAGDDQADTADLDPNQPCSATLKVVNAWEGGFQADVTVVGHRDIGGWKVSFSLPSGNGIADMWNGNPNAKTGTVTVTDAGWNGTLGRGESGQFGFTGTGGSPGDDLTLTCVES